MKIVLVRHGETEWNKLGRFQGHSDIRSKFPGHRSSRGNSQRGGAVEALGSLLPAR